MALDTKIVQSATAREKNATQEHAAMPKFATSEKVASGEKSLTWNMLVRADFWSPLVP